MKPLTLSILRLLSDGEFHSGEEMAQQLGVSRASISNALKLVDANSVSIYKVRGRGYCLAQPLQWIDPHQVTQALGARANLFNLEVLDVVGSTNSILMQKASAGAPHASCVVAELQTGGRGRRGRIWHTDLGGALTFSVLWRFNQGAAFLSGLSLAVGVAVVRALQEFAVTGVALKWPNDVLHGYHKLAGILIEVQGDVLGPSAVVIGIGLNVRLNNQTRECVDQPITDLHAIVGEALDRNVLLARVLIHLATVLESFEQDGFVGVRDEWLKMHAYQDKPVRLLMPSGEWREGHVLDVAEDGALLVNTLQGRQKFTSGEISLRRAHHDTCN